MHKDKMDICVVGGGESWEDSAKTNQTRRRLRMTPHECVCLCA